MGAYLVVIVASLTGFAVAVTIAAVGAARPDLVAHDALQISLMVVAIVVFALGVLMHPSTVARGGHARASLLRALRHSPWWATALLIVAISWLVYASIRLEGAQAADPQPVAGSGCTFRAGSKRFAMTESQLRHRPDRIEAIAAFDGLFCAVANLLAASGLRERSRLPF